jgi:hypothetical protein
MKYQMKKESSINNGENESENESRNEENINIEMKK